MADPAPLPCRSCFWSAELTREAERVWCAHAGWAGWYGERAGCGGVSFVQHRPWHSSLQAYERHASLGD